MTTAPYIALATVLDRLDRWWDAKREEWGVAKLLVDEVAAGYIPSPEAVGLLPVPTEPDIEVLAIPSEHVEARPVDLDDCPRCEGQGMFVSYEDGEAAYRRCGWCSGTGEIAPGRGWVA